jgi:nucleoside-diphosphate-sugar epimerase
MRDALFGYSGLVGQTLLRQRHFDALYRSTNVSDSAGEQFDTVVCAAAPAKKWWANQNAAADQEVIETLIQKLSAIQCRQFILVSTVDVFVRPVGVDETSAVEVEGLCPYGLHRHILEQRTRELFPQAMIVRLPGLVGPGLKKNVIYDLHNANDLHAVDSRAVFQFYPLVNLWSDIEKALRRGLSCVHLTAEPISVSDVAERGFGRRFSNEVVPQPACYDMQTVHGAVYGVAARYQCTARETLLAVRAYAQTEPRTAGT